MRVESLNGEWKLYYWRQDRSSVGRPSDLAQSGMESVPATVPGNVELDLVSAGKLGDPLIGDGVRQLRDLELNEWWYEKEFLVADAFHPGKVEMVFHGVDCLATYWLNGVLLGASENMLVEHRFNVTEHLMKGKINRLHVRLRSPLMAALEEEYDPGYVSWHIDWDRLWIRKAAHSYGWDIMPRALSAGIWRSVELVFHGPYEILDAYVQTIAADDKQARLALFFQLGMPPAALMENLSLRLSGACKNSQFEFLSAVRFSSGALSNGFHVPNPELWWPRGYGEAHLYEATLEFLVNGNIEASRNLQFGIREVELVRSDVAGDRDGQFLLKINNTPILCKGTNWVPADVFHSRDAERIPSILAMAVELNCNIVRCWGGNVYEDHSFFDLCDRNGLMVWQDFSMACAPYPQDERFLEKVRQEGISVVRKLRRHASIVLWCGDNECDYLYVDPDKNRITREVLPQVIAKCDPFRPYLPSSPYLSPTYILEKAASSPPEDHIWGPRDYYKSPYYTDHKAHFVSEIGYHGCPNVSSIRKFIDEPHVWPWQDNRQWILHSTDMADNPYRVELMANQIRELFGFIPDSMEDFVLASQISQAEAKKTFIEMTRLKKWRRTGIIWWNLMDGWPQFSDAIVDYFFGKKLAYHYIRRSQESVCLMVREPENWAVEVMAGNDSNQASRGDYRIVDADGDRLLAEGAFQVEANENASLVRIPISRSDKKLILLEWTIGDEKHGNHYLLGQPPFSLSQYKLWLKRIASLEGDFDAESVGH